MFKTALSVSLVVALVATVRAESPDPASRQTLFRERADRALLIDGDPKFSPQAKVWAWMRVVTTSGKDTEGLTPSLRDARNRMSYWQDALGAEYGMWGEWFKIVRSLGTSPSESRDQVGFFLRRWEGSAGSSGAVREARVLQKAKPGADLEKALANERKKDKLRGFVRIDPGAFAMGSPLHEAMRDNDETQHDVELHWPFWLSQTEVTQREWLRYVGTNPSKFKGGGLDTPVDSVSWEEAAYFLNAMSRAEGLEECYGLGECKGEVGGGCQGKTVDNGMCDSDYTCTLIRSSGTACGGYRLPTEAEWEYAARAGTDTATHIGDFAGQGPLDYPKLESFVTFAVNSQVDYDSGWKCNKAVVALAGKWCGPSQVGKRKPNPWGLYDMLGNVFELVSDYALGDRRYMLREDRQAEVNPTGPALTGWGNMVRGGAWFMTAREARAAFRYSLMKSKRHVMVGFRVARTIR